MTAFPLELITADRVLLSENVRSVRVPGIAGSLGVLAGHAPLMTALGVGIIKVEFENGDLEYIATSGGFMEVSLKKVIILADTAERAAEIDVARADAAISRARGRLNSAETIDYPRAQMALERATNRLRAAQRQSESQ